MFNQCSGGTGYHFPKGIWIVFDRLEIVMRESRKREIEERW